MRERVLIKGLRQIFERAFHRRRDAGWFHR